MQHLASRQPNTSIYTWWLDICLLSIFLGLLYFSFLGVRPLFVPDEGRYAEIIREMATSGDYITPHLNGIKYFEKPVLFYWLGALLSQISQSVGMLRVINACLGLSGCLVVYMTTRQLFDRTTGLIAAAILGTSLLYFAMAHLINLDMAVSFFITTTLCCYLLGIRSQQRSYFWFAAISAAFAVLTKGLIGIVFPTIIIGCWTLLLNKWKEIKHWHVFSSLLIFIAIALPWHLLVWQKNPEFFYLYIIEQHFLRFTDPNIGHYSPIWYFIPCLLIGFFPWIVFLPATIRAYFPTSISILRSKPIELFLLLWAILIFVFFSLSKSKLISYILPVIPPLAILTAHYLKEHGRAKTSRAIQISWIGMILFAAALSCALFIFLHNAPFPSPTLANKYLGTAGLVLIIGILFSGIIGFWRPFIGIASTAGILSIFLLLATVGAPAIDTRTILPLAQILQPLLNDRDEVITYNQYYQDLPYYLNRTVTILNWQNELSPGMRYQDTHEWMINDKQFWQRWNSPNRVFVIISRDEFDNFQAKHPSKKPRVLGRTINNVLMVNQ